MSDQEVGSLVLARVFDRPPQALRSGEAAWAADFAAWAVRNQILMALEPLPC